MKKLLLLSLILFSLSGCCQKKLLFDDIPNVESGCYGYLYSGYVVDDSRKLTSSDSWSIPSKTELEDLQTYLGGTLVSGGKLKEIGLSYWSSPNTGAADDYDFKARGTGVRTSSGGLFSNINEVTYLWSSTPSFGNLWWLRLEYDSSESSINVSDRGFGYSIRIISDATGIPDGTQIIYTGNDGKVYPAITINQKYWLQQNLEETKYRNGDTIPEEQNATNWINLTTGAWCVYNNNSANKCK